MDYSVRKSIEGILGAYNEFSYVSDEWADYDETQLMDAARKNKNAAEYMKHYQIVLNATYKDRFGLVPELSEEEKLNPKWLEEARRVLEKEKQHPFVLNPPTGLFSKKPKKQDYYACGCALQMMEFHYSLTAARQEMYARRFYNELAYDIQSCRDYFSSSLINDTRDPEKYSHYLRPEGESTSIYIGDIMQYMEDSKSISEKAAHRLDQVFEESGFVRKREMNIPCTFDAREPFVLFINHTYSLDHSDEAVYPANLLHSIIYQIIRSMPAYSYQITYMDPLGAGNTLCELQGLTSVRDGNAFWLHQGLFNNLYIMFDLVANKDDFQPKLSNLAGRVGRVNTIRGHISSITGYNASMFNSDGSCIDSAQIIPQQFIVIENVHGMLSGDTCQKIETMINNADQCGISLVIVSSRSSVESMDEFEKRLIRNQRMDVIDWSSQGASLSTRTPFWGEEKRGTYRYGLKPCHQAVSYPRFISSIKEEMKPNLNINTGFKELLDIFRLWGSRDGTDSVQVPVGVNERGRVVEIEFGGSYSNGLLAGTIGCGKSSFLHTIINGVLMYYRPEDVEIWISDYKTVEFLRYSEKTPANIKYVGTARTKEYSLALLDKIEKEYERRQALFGTVRATSLREYRQKRGKDSMTRLLVIVDEFHVMSNHIKDEPDYSTKLGNILREARAMGMSVLLSDQTCGVGLQGLKEDARMQLNCRMAMRTTIDEYNAVFMINNSSEVIPKVLNFEVILKREQKRIDENGNEKIGVFYEHAKTIYTPPEVRDEIAQKSIDTYGENEKVVCITSDLRAPADWKEIFKESSDITERSGIRLFPGIPKDLKSYMQILLREKYSENLLSIGQDDVLQAEILLHVVESIDRSGKPYKVKFFSGEYDDVFRISEEWIKTFCGTHVNAELLTDEAGICRNISNLVNDLDDRYKKGQNELIFLIWLGMPELCRDLEHLPLKKDSKGEESESAYRKKQSENHVADLDSMFNNLFGEMSVELSQSKESIMEKSDDEVLYNASEDIRRLLDEGARRGIHSLVFNPSVSVSRRVRCAKFEYFTHKIALSMSRDDANDFLGSYRYVMTPENEIIDNKTAVYFDGKKAVHFVPFIDERIESVKK